VPADQGWHAQESGLSKLREPRVIEGRSYGVVIAINQATGVMLIEMDSGKQFHLKAQAQP
jgi:hypothetical protein